MPECHLSHWRVGTLTHRPRDPLRAFAPLGGPRRTLDTQIPRYPDTQIPTSVQCRDIGDTAHGYSSPGFRSRSMGIWRSRWVPYHNSTVPLDSSTRTYSPTR